MEPDDCTRYLQLVAQCKDIATEIHSQYREMCPNSVNEMTALDPDHCAAPLSY